MNNFGDEFKLLTGNPPFPWQERLYRRFVGELPGGIPSSCSLPTGLGKTSVVAIWLLALAHRPAVIPRRLVYVVNRRTVVDQTTSEVERYREALRTESLRSVHDQLATMVALPQRTRDGEPVSPLALSTLRGQFADNRDWSADPCRPAVICGTVDMIGSRLLFSGYGVGMKAKPLHAGFLGQDVLLVHDEAHLESAFQTLIEAIRDEQAREPSVPWPKFRVMELTATSRSDGDMFGLNGDDGDDATVAKRIKAKKAIYFHELREKNRLAEQVADQALTFKDSGGAVVVFVRTVEDVLKIRDKLEKAKLPVRTLTGTMRGKERDELVEDKTFARFLHTPPGDATEDTVYLVCTSAGEVGVNISADHLVCDLSTFESMAQRFGRVNRFGLFDECEIHLFSPTGFDEDDEYDIRRAKTLTLLRNLPKSISDKSGDCVDGSPAALGDLPAADRQAAFAPPPTLLPATDILFDAWALTTIRQKLPGRPPVEPYLHGLPTSWEPPQTQVAWREEVCEISGDLLAEYPPEELLDVFPLQPHELLREPSHRAFKHFEEIAKRRPDDRAWLVDDDGKIVRLTLSELADRELKDQINGKTVILPPSAGGLEAGMLNGSSTTASDVADTADRVRVWTDDEQFDEKTDGMHCVQRIVFPSSADEDAEERAWLWFVTVNEGDKSARLPVLWDVHVGDVVGNMRRITANLPLEDSLKHALITAAEFHDHGKKRKQFQTVLGNTAPGIWLAKSGKRGGRVAETYRHEFGSVLDVERDLAGEHRDLILHLIAAHHGRARPHFPPEESFDPERPQSAAEDLAMSVPRRFSRLQRQYGRWGLAYLESLLRAADWAASASPSKYLGEEP